MSNASWTVEPNVSVNGLLFGSARSVVRKMLGRPESVFRKTATSTNTTDAYSGYHVYYTANDTLEAIEFFGDSIELTVDSSIIFPGTLASVRKALPDLEGKYGFYESKRYSIGVYEEDNEIISILIGRKGYYQ